MKRHYIIPIFVPHLGCPHDCVFCNQSNITGEDRENAKNINYNFVLRTAQEYLNTMDKENSIVELSFFGGTFTAIEVNVQEDLLKAAYELKQNGKIDKIRCSTRPDYIDIGILSRLKKYGMDTIELGVQSLDEEVLKKSGRGHSAKSVENASKLIKEFKITLGHQIMPGLPGDSEERIIETAKKSIAMKPDEVRIYPTVVIKDTAMEDMFNEGTYKPLQLREAVRICSNLKLMYENSNVKVIRVGLQMSENLTLERDLVAGPFHSAFGELCESYILNNSIFNLIKEMEILLKREVREEKVEILISERKISKLFADKKFYFNELEKRLMEETKVKKVEVKIIRKEEIIQNDMNENEVVVKYQEDMIKILV